MKPYVELAQMEENRINLDEGQTKILLESFGLISFENAKVGYYLKLQLISLYLSGHLNPRCVVREIKHLEGLGESRTKKAKRFTSGKIKGFHHKHFFTNKHLLTNMYLHYSDKELGKLGEGFKRMVGRVLSSGESFEEQAAKIATSATRDAFINRTKSKSMTGDWIIYKECGGTNYYLGVFEHKMNTDEIFDILELQYKNTWPFLFKN